MAVISHWATASTVVWTHCSSQIPTGSQSASALAEFPHSWKGYGLFQQHKLQDNGISHQNSLKYVAANGETGSSSDTAALLGP